MSTNRVLVAGVLFGIVVLAVSAVRPADAIPAFARKYRFSCSTCHAPFPRLKPFGDEFAGRGFRLEDPSQEPTRATYDVGDPLLKLSRDLPLAVRMDAFASWKENADAEFDFEWPWAVKFLSGGPITDSISYYFYGILEQGESIKLEDTFIHFSSVFGSGIDIMIGQFQLCDPLFKRELRLEREDYAIFKTRIGLAPTNLTYDRGIVLSWQFPGEIDAVAQVVNGNGIDPAEHDNFDDNNLKNASLRLARQFGPVRVGVFGYSGRAEQESERNKITYFGPDLVVDLGEKWQLNAQYLERRDDNPYLDGYDGPDFKTTGGFAELLFFPQGQDGRWVLSALYNNVDSDDCSAKYESAALTVNRLLARNVRLLLEAAHDLNVDTTRLTVGVITAF